MEQNTQTTSTEERTGVQQPAPENGSTQPEQEKRFTQSDVDRIVKERLKRAERTADSAQADELNAQRAELTQRQNRLECREYLLNSGYNPELLDILDTNNPNDFKSKADKLQRLIKASGPRVVAPLSMIGQEDVPRGQGLAKAFNRNAKHKPKSWPPSFDDDSNF